jgi:GAF domain-containing protein
MSARTPGTPPLGRTHGPRTPLSPQPLRPEEAIYQDLAPGLEERMRALEMERTRLEQEVATLKAEQQHFLERYTGLEEQSATLTTLYVACQRLHSHLSRKEVLLAVRELLSNLIGCEQYVLFSVAADGWLHRVDSFGFDSAAFDWLAPGTGLIGHAAETAETYLRQESDGGGTTAAESNLTACVPLEREGIVTGAVALFRLLPQKFDFQELDRELFELFKTHLATVLYCADLHESVKTRNGATP